MKHRAWVAGLVVLGLTQRPAPAEEGVSDPAAVALADSVVAALGGEAAWTKTRFLSFDCAEERNGKEVMSRSHTWDKWTGRYRFEERKQTGEHLVVLMNINTREGVAYINDTRVDGDAERAELESAFGAWMRDTYWLLMPYKLKDPGVNLTMAGEAKTKEGVWDKLLLTFDNVGSTPQDRYWVYVNRETRFVDRWDFLLTGQTTRRPTTYEWKGWTNVGPLLLASERLNARTGVRVYFPVLAAPATVDDLVFELP